MNSLDNLFGEICKVLLPIPQEVYLGNQESSIAICTLSSIDLLKQISNSSTLYKVAIVGRLLSENKGIDTLVRYVNKKRIQTIILCGKEVWGHKAGHSLLELHENGIDDKGRIINSPSPAPYLEITKKEAQKFRAQVNIINKMGETNYFKIKETVNSLSS